MGWWWGDAPAGAGVCGVVGDDAPAGAGVCGVVVDDAPAGAGVCGVVVVVDDAPSRGRGVWGGGG